MARIPSMIMETYQTPLILISSILFHHAYDNHFALILN